MTRELREVLEQAADSAPLADSDLAPNAWYAAQQARRRARLLAAASVLLLVGVGWAISARLTQAPQTLPAVTTTQTPIDALPANVKGGLEVEQAASPAKEPELPRLSADLSTGLPQRLGFDPDATVRRFSDLGHLQNSAAAVLLRRVSGGYHPVVLLAAAGDAAASPLSRYVELDSVLIKPFNAETPDPYVVLGPRVIAPDGHRLAFVQPGEVVGVDLLTGTVARVSLPATDSLSGGWTAGNTWFVVVGDSGQWRVDPFTQTVQPVAETVYDGRGSIRTTSSGSSPGLVTFDDDGVALYQRELSPWLAEQWADTVTSSVAWSATGTYLTPDSQAELESSYQGVVAAQPTGRPRLLVSPQQGPTKQCCTVLSWAAPTVVLYASRSSSAMGAESNRLLAWEVTSGRQWFVADLPTGIFPTGEADTRLGALLPQVSLAQHP